MSHPKALIFDVDGTLADTERDGHRVAFNHAFAEVGLDWHWDEALYGSLLEVTGGKERIHYFATRFLDGFEWPGDAESSIAELHAIKTRRYQEMLEMGDIPLRPGVAGFLSKAREAGLQLAIATTTTPGNVTGLLKANLGEDAEALFSVIAAGDVVPAKKPAPDIYLHALEQLRADANECIAFEDSRPGLLSALAAGLRTVVVTNGYTAGQDFSGASMVASDWNGADLKKLIKNLLLHKTIL